MFYSAGFFAKAFVPGFALLVTNVLFMFQFILNLILCALPGRVYYFDTFL